MKRTHIAILLGLVASASAQQNEVLIEDNRAVAAGTYRHYIGHGRAATLSINGACGTRSRLAYGFAGNFSCPFNDTAVTCETSGTYQRCIPSRRGEIDVCIPVQVVTTLDVTFPPNTDINATSVLPSDANQFFFYSPESNNIAQGFKGFGNRDYEWFIEYTVENDLAAGDCPAGVTATAKAITPENAYCLKANDTEFTGFEDDERKYFALGAELLRHEGDQYVISTKVVGGDLPDFVASTADLTINSRVWELGLSPRIELSCLQLFVTPQNPLDVDAVPQTQCNSMQYGLGNAAGQSDLWDLQLIDAPDCNVSAISTSCCAITNQADCRVNGTNNCFWIPREDSVFENRGWCVPSDETRFVDLSGIVGSTQELFVFASDKVDTPDSSFIGSPDEQEWNSESQRRWFIRFINRATSVLPATGPRGETPSPTTSAADDFRQVCPVSVSLSYISHTTGGICEPSSRALCDTTEAKCTVTDLADHPRYWKQNAPDSEFLSIIDDDKYKVCNCLKQKEICYRRNGCVSTKKYLLLLQNCVEQGCGNYCNPASAASVSLVTLVMALVVSLL